MTRDEAIRRVNQATVTRTGMVDLVLAVRRETLEEAVKIVERHSDAAPSVPDYPSSFLDRAVDEIRELAAKEAP